MMERKKNIISKTVYVLVTKLLGTYVRTTTRLNIQII